MAFRIEFASEIPFRLDRTIVASIAEILWKIAPENQRGIVNVAFVDDETMRSYNSRYRNVDKTTDVLSFHYFDDFSECPDDAVAWEILLSESRIREQAPEYENDPETETYKLLVHSLAHLLGYDHEDDDEYAAMKEIEDVVIARVSEKFGIFLR